MAIKKSAHPRGLPGVHPGLRERIRNAEEAELRGEMPRPIDGAQRVIRPSLDTTEPERRLQARTLGLVDPAYRATQDGLAAIAAQAAFMPGTELDRVWDSLSEVDKIRAGASERFRLEMEASLRLAHKPWRPPHQLGGRLDARNLKRSSDNILAELASVDYLLAADSRALLCAFVEDTHKLIDTCLKQRAVQGIDAVPMHELMRDLVHKLVYQEIVSRRRAMGDRGVRRICGNIALAERVYAQLRGLPDFSPRERLLMRIIHVHQDLGHVAFAARVSFRGSKLHRAYGARIFADEANRYRVLLTHDEIELVQNAVTTHAGEELPYAQARVLALVRAVDHLAPFAPHRVYSHLQRIDGASDYLDDLLARARAGRADDYLAAKGAFVSFLDAVDMEQALRDDLCAAFRPVERQADIVELGDLAGEVQELQWGHDELRVTLASDGFAQRYQALFDQQQEQLLRFAMATGVTAGDLRAKRTLTFRKAGSGGLRIERLA
ncbi:MAG: hypothetical protein HYZ27_00275 [Deltaproteobacteria bacterium]|nr:hypothetical protein [Deltaproteobacteria bacterium]